MNGRMLVFSTALALVISAQCSAAADPAEVGPNSQIEEFEREKRLRDETDRKQSSPSEKCMVVDPDLQGTYTGQCVRGLADGQGKAVGRDTYVGEFKAGMKHGQGVYSWSDGARFEGEYRNNNKLIGTMHFPPGHPGRTAREYAGKGRLEGNDYVLVGRFGEFGFTPCVSLSQCR
jgi:hypothetical protein